MSKKQIIKVVLGWIIGLTAIGFCVYTLVDCWDEFTAQSTGISVWMLAGGVGCIFLSYLVLSLGWHVLMKDISPGLRLRTTMRAWGYSQVAKYIPGKVMVFVVRMQACGAEGATPSKVLAGAGLDVILSLVCTLVISMASWVVIPGQWGLLRWTCMGAFVCTLVMVHPKVIMMIMGRYYRMRGISRDEVPALTNASILKPLVFYMIGWLLYCAGGCLVLRSVSGGLPDSFAGNLAVAGGFAISWTVGYLVVLAPGGLGVREGVLLAVITPLVASHGVAGVVVVLARLVQGGLDLLFGVGWWVIRRFEKQSRTGHEHGRTTEEPDTQSQG